MRFCAGPAVTIGGGLQKFRRFQTVKGHCVTLFLRPLVEEEVLGKAYDGRLMRRLLGYLRPYKVAVAVSLFFLILQSIAQLVGPLLTKLAIDRYLVKPEHPQPSPLDPW